MIRLCAAVMIVACLFGATLAPAQEREYFLPEPSMQTYAVILVGPSPEQAYGEQIRRWGLRLYDILAKDYGYSHDHIILLMSGSDADDARISGTCRLDILQEKIKRLKKSVRPGDQILFFLIGHGTSDEEEAKFVLTGPDITGQGFAATIEPFAAQDIVVVNAASASFPFSAALTGPGRVLVSATRSRAEKYNTEFAQYFIDALDDHAGDRDKNKRVSVWEAFLFASQKVEKWYVDQDRIPTEHSVLEDNGDGIFSRDPDPGQGDGNLAQIAYLDPLIAAGAPVLKRTLDAKIRALERAVFLLRNRKADLPAETYRQEMEKLLIELARTSKRGRP
jgi:hypothetical protein